MPRRGFFELPHKVFHGPGRVNETVFDEDIACPGTIASGAD